VTRVIVVEDDADIRQVISEALDDEGYQVTGATDGVSALRLVAEQPPDIAIVDLMMPQLDGLGFLAECRADPRCASMRVIVISAATSARLDGLQVEAVITKPFDLNALVDTVASIASV
jgi:DNA-binding response OmpR family regulator